MVEEINLKPTINKHSTRLNQILEGSQQALSKEEQILDSSYYDWKNNDISKEQYQRIRGESESKLQQLRATLRMIANEQQKMANGIEANNTYFERFIKYQEIEELDRLMVIDLINRIEISEDKSVHIEFNFQNQYLLIMDFIEQNEPAMKKTLENKN